MRTKRLSSKTYSGRVEPCRRNRSSTLSESTARVKEHQIQFALATLAQAKIGMLFSPLLGVVKEVAGVGYIGKPEERPSK